MNKKQKFFIFYLVSFLGAIILFNAITIYGENKLQAAPKIGGNYNLNTTLYCLQEKKFLLTLEQSGLYLFADLVLQEEQIHILMSGTLNNETISLSTNETTKINALLAQCSVSVATIKLLALQGTVENNNISGKIKMNEKEPGINFTAKKQESITQPTQNSH